MKANELMIGDWVLNRKKFTDVKPIRLSQADFCLWKADGIYAKDYIECDPIPLTPEILEKNGFENDFYEEESVADYRTIRLEGYSLEHREYLVTWCNGCINVMTDFNGCVQKEVSYVHELQHAMKLCGIEKEIIL